MQNTKTSSSISPEFPDRETAPIQGRWPRLMRRPAVAEYLNVSDRYVDELVSAGYIPGPRLTPSIRCVLWDRNQIDQWLNDTTPDVPSDARSFDDIIRDQERV